MMKVYQQCLLRRGSTDTVAWIEQRGCKVGAAVQFAPVNQLWTVVDVYDHKLTADQLGEYQLLNRHACIQFSRIA